MREWGNHREEDEEKRSNSGLYIGSIILVTTVSLFMIAIIEPVLLIGAIWDWDIKDQLIMANSNALADLENEKQSTMVYYRFIYDNNPDTEIRLERAVRVFQETFAHPDNNFEIKRFENTTLLEFTWQADKGI